HRVDLDTDADAAEVGLQLLRQELVADAGDRGVDDRQLEGEAVRVAGLLQELARLGEVLLVADLARGLFGRAVGADRQEARRPRRGAADQGVYDAVVVDRPADRLAVLLLA